MFIVEKDGTLSHIMLVRGKELSPFLDQAALDVMYKSPRWIPAKMSNGTIVRSKKIVRIAFNKQTDVFVYEATDSIHVTTPPQFSGGDKAFGKFLASHLIYPPGAIAGITYIQFIIEKDGSLSNIKPVEGKGLNQPCDEEAIRVLSNSPKWTPGMKNGLPIRTRKIQSATFGSPRNQKKNTY